MTLFDLFLKIVFAILAIVFCGYMIIICIVVIREFIQKRRENKNDCSVSRKPRN